MATGIEIAREVIRFYAELERDTTAEVRQCDLLAELYWLFPDASAAELERGYLIACDQTEMWTEDVKRREDAIKQALENIELLRERCARSHAAGKVFQSVSALRSDISAAAAAAERSLKRLHFTPDNVIPAEPRKDAS